MSPYVIGVAGLVLVGAATFGGRALYEAGYTAARLETLSTETLIEQIALKSQEAAAHEIAKIQVKHVTIRQNLEKELTRDVVYRECVASPRVLELTNSALTRGPDAAADRLLPEPDAPR